MQGRTGLSISMKHQRMMYTLVACLLISASVAWSQAVNATLLGTVTDASGAVISNARVVAVETSTNVSHTAQTNDSGNYNLPDLPPGTYSVTAEMTGFKKESRTGVAVEVNTSTRVDLQLQVGNMIDTVEVTGAA